MCQSPFLPTYRLLDRRKSADSFPSGYLVPDVETYHDDLIDQGAEELVLVGNEIIAPGLIYLAGGLELGKIGDILTSLGDGCGASKIDLLLNRDQWNRDGSSPILEYL